MKTKTSFTEKQPADDFYVSQHRHARRCYVEAMTAGAIWLVAFMVCTVTMFKLGYVPVSERPDEPNLVLGFPSWVFVGLVVPWIVLVGVIWLFAAFVLKDDEPYQEFPRDAQAERLARRSAEKPEGNE